MILSQPSTFTFLLPIYINWNIHFLHKLSSSLSIIHTSIEAFFSKDQLKSESNHDALSINMPYLIIGQFINNKFNSSSSKGRLEAKLSVRKQTKKRGGLKENDLGLCKGKIGIVGNSNSVERNNAAGEMGNRVVRCAVRRREARRRLICQHPLLYDYDIDLPGQYSIVMIQQRAALKDGVHEMTLDHLEDVKEVMASAFLQNNEIWSSFTIKKEDILEFFDRLIRGHLASQQRTKELYGDHICHCMIYVVRGRIVSSILHYQLEDYRMLQKEEKPQKLQLFRELEKEGKELMKSVNVGEYPQGKALYANFGGVHPDYDVSGLYKLILFIKYHKRMKQSGFRWIVGRVSNVRAMELYKKIGARIIKEVSFDRNGKQFRLFFFDFDMNGEGFTFCEENFEKMIEKEREMSIRKKSKL